MSKSVPSGLLSSLVCFALLPAAIPAQSTPRRAPAQSMLRTVQRPTEPRERGLDPRSYHQDRFILKFREGSRVRLGRRSTDRGTGRDLASPDGLDLGGVRRLLGALRIERLFTRPVPELDRERNRILEALPESVAAPADLNNYFRVLTRGRQETIRVMLALLEDPCVETALPEFHLGGIAQAAFQGRPGPDARSTTPFFETHQYHLVQSPLGLGLMDVLGILGASGNPSQVIAHLEVSWIFGHEDLPALSLENVLGLKNWRGLLGQWRDHGTAAAGILHASRDSKGVRGFVPCSRLFVSSIINGYGNMVSLATAEAGPGDVFSSSFAFALYHRNKAFHAPMDWHQETYDAVRTATLKGIVITVAAGNTGADLATRAVYGTRYLPSSTPSGAVICGATEGPEMKQASWSNYGDAVRANAWGAYLTTTAYGQLWKESQGGRKSYTNQFSGTSGAAPQVAGALASIQSIAKVQRGKAFSPEKLMAAIERKGVRIEGRIGVRPNILGTLEDLGLWKGLRIMNEAAPGKTVYVEVHLEPMAAYSLLASPAVDRTPLGLSFPLLLNPAAIQVLHSGIMGPSSRQYLTVSLPPDPRLHGARFFFQAVWGGSRSWST
ncbi:MAG: S8 family serine peptidase [Planctomycetota bacterium]